MHSDHGLEALCGTRAGLYDVGAGPSIVPEDIELSFLLCKGCRRCLDRLDVVEIELQAFESAGCFGEWRSLCDGLDGLLCSSLSGC